MRFQSYGWLTVAISASLVLSACKTNSNRKNEMSCAPEVESLSLSLGDQVNRFMDVLEKYDRKRVDINEVRRTARKTVQICEEFRSYQTQSSCLSRDQFSGQEVRVDRDLYIDECNLAAQYSGHVNPHPPSSGGGGAHWSDQSVDQFRARTLALRVKDLNAVTNAMRDSRAFLNGRLVSRQEAQTAAQRGDVACAVNTRSRLATDVNLPVTEIRDLSRRGDQNQGFQSFTLIAEGDRTKLELSCQTYSRRGATMTPKDIQRALGAAIEIRYSSRY